MRKREVLGHSEVRFLGRESCASATPDLLRRVGWVVTEAAGEWRVSANTVLLFMLLPFMLPAICVLAAAIDKSWFKFLLDEDALYENLQVFCLILCVFLSAKLATRLRRNGRNLLSLLYWSLVVGLVFILGEEISWGQRIFGWETPETWLEANRQGETNIHNLYSVDLLFRIGQLLVGVFGTLAPLYAFHRFSRAEFRRLYSYFIPHFALVPYFLVVLIWRLYRTLFDPPAEWYYAIARFNESIELVIYMAGALFLYYHFRRRTYSLTRD